jgi:hypothetical protein
MNAIRAAFSIPSRILAVVIEAARRTATAIALAAALCAIAVSGAAAQDDQSKEEQGLVVYLGVLPAAMVKGHDSTHAETTMHGGTPAGLHEYHLLVAVFEAATGERVEDATVTAMITGLGHVGGTRTALEPMKIADTTTYGNFVDLPGSDLYTIKVAVKLMAASHPSRRIRL